MLSCHETHSCRFCTWHSWMFFDCGNFVSSKFSKFLPHPTFLVHSQSLKQSGVSMSLESQHPLCFLAGLNQWEIALCIEYSGVMEM